LLKRNTATFRRTAAAVRRNVAVFLLSNPYWGLRVGHEYSVHEFSAIEVTQADFRPRRLRM